MNPAARARANRRCSNPPGVCRRVRPRDLIEGTALPDRSPRVWFLVGFTWCRRVESNHRPRAYESLALPLSYVGNGGRMVPDAFRPSNAPVRECPSGRIGGSSAKLPRPRRGFECLRADAALDFSPPRTDLLTGLNEEQREAVLAIDGPCWSSPVLGPAKRACSLIASPT